MAALSGCTSDPSEASGQHWDDTITRMEKVYRGPAENDASKVGQKARVMMLMIDRIESDGGLQPSYGLHCKLAHGQQDDILWSTFSDEVMEKQVAAMRVLVEGSEHLLHQALASGEVERNLVARVGGGGWGVGDARAAKRLTPCTAHRTLHTPCAMHHTAHIIHYHYSPQAGLLIDLGLIDRELYELGHGGGDGVENETETMDQGAAAELADYLSQEPAEEDIKSLDDALKGGQKAQAKGKNSIRNNVAER
mmetsp:Transcript_37942/g.65437  ORF Transcript_37942/g.65437 Transcript_37942/m.65437 type:complete len:251 (+) Transcript_37942:86-838(+)